MQATGEPGAPDADASTRERVLQLIVEKGPVSAAQLGKELHLTAAAVRRHLDVMASQGIIEVKNVSSRKRGAGRPSRRYVLSSAGQESLGNDYLRLLRLALEDPALRGIETEQSSFDTTEHSSTDQEPTDSSAAQHSSIERRLAKAYFADFEQRYAHKLAQESDLAARTQKLSELLHQDGFAGFVRRIGRDSAVLAMQSSQLCQGHCPIREIAAEYPVFCEEETAMFSRVLEVDLRRLSTQAAGDHVCTTHVPVGRQELAASQRIRITSGAGSVHDVPQTRSGRRRIVLSPRQQERLS